MPTLKLQNFSGGLDTRRSELTSQLNVLETLVNAHVNQGAELEKRKAFVPGPVPFSANVFGLETGVSLFAFGSAAIGAVTVPVNVTYIQCPHPADPTRSMTALLCSCDFGGNAWCAATFSDGKTFLFLNGQIIGPSIAGQIFTNNGVGTAQTNAQITAQMYGILAGTDFSKYGIFVSNLSNNGFQIYTAYGVTWTPTVIVESAGSGQITTALITTGIAPVVGSSGGAQVTIFAGTSGSIITLNDNAGATVYKLITSAVAFTTNVSTTAGALATAIKSQSTLAGTTASQSTNTVSIATTTSLPSNNLSFQVSGNLCLENLSLDFSGVTGGPTVKNIYTSNGTSLNVNLKYGTGGLLAGKSTGTVANEATFTLAYGTYIWIPGANDNYLGISGVQYPKSTYPNGFVFTYDASTAPNYINFSGKANTSCTFGLYKLTDIMNSGGGVTLGTPPTAAQITSIAAAITANSGTTGWVASNTGVSGVAGTIMWLSRINVSVTPSAYNNIYIYTALTGISPSGFAPITPPTSFGFSQATNSTVGQGTTYQVTFSGAWVAGDTYTFDIVTPAQTYTAGIGNITGLVPSACMTLANRVHFVAGSSWCGSDNGDATAWEQQNPGAFAIDVSQYFQQADTLVSLADYQGYMALFANYVTLIYILDANPQNITLKQPLANIGTFCPLGPQSIGELDVVFPSVTGLRSLRVRDLSLNAYVNDLGSPVDIPFQNDILAVGFSNLAGQSCGIVEPSASRYWLYINGKIYVLSYFPSAKIMAAWSIYLPTDSNGKTFVPIKFVIFQGQVWFVATQGGQNWLYNFGGANNNVYDVSQVTVATPWLDVDEPQVRKQLYNLDWATTGAWQFSMSMDYLGVTNKGALLRLLTTSPSNTVSFQLGSYPLSDDGYHIKVQATTVSPSRAVLSSMLIGFRMKEPKV